MKKIKLLLTYLSALFCVGFTLLSKPNQKPVFQMVTHQVDNRVMIYMMNEQQELVPIYLHQESSLDLEDKIEQLIMFMKQDFEIYDLKPLLPKRIQCLGVELDEKNVKVHFNEAFLTLNSSYDLRVVEAIVSVITQFDSTYKVEFFVNDEKISQMPLSSLPIVKLDYSLGVNNFQIHYDDLHVSVARQIVQRSQEQDYYVIYTKRYAQSDTLSFVNLILDEQNHNLECEKIDIQKDKTVLYLNEAFLVEENIVDDEKIEPLLFTLKLNQMGNVFEIMIQDEMVQVQGYGTFHIDFKDLKLNTFD